MSTWIRDRNCFSSRFKVDPSKRDQFERVFDELCTFAKPYYDRGCAFAFQGWARDNTGLLDCCVGPVVMEQFSGMNKDRSVFDIYPAGSSQIHTPGKVHEVVFR